MALWRRPPSRSGKPTSAVDAANLRGQLGELRGAGLEKRRAQTAVFRGLAAQATAPAHDESAPPAASASTALDEPPRVAGEIAEHLIQLRDRDPHRKNLSMQRARRPAQRKLRRHA